MKTSFKYFGIIALLLLFSTCKQDKDQTDIDRTNTSEVSKEIARVEPLDEKEYLMESDGFIYDIKPRFSTITKSELQKATSFDDFIGQEHSDRIVKYKSVSVILLDDDQQTDIRENGNTGEFNSKQLELLRSFDHSTNILIRADYDEKFDFSEDLFAESWTPHFTIVPETQTSYSEGVEALLSEIQEQSKVLWSKINTDNLKPGRISFTISKDGTLINISVDNSCGYGHIDEKLKSFILNSNGKWIPAKDSNGLNVDQKLVLSYGALGC